MKLCTTSLIYFLIFLILSIAIQKHFPKHISEEDNFLNLDETEKVELKIFRKCVDPGTVALTWDDGPVAGPTSNATQTLIQFFKMKGIKVTFFLIASRLKDPAKLYAAKEALREGHEIGSHSLSHADFLKIFHNHPKQFENGCEAIIHQMKNSNELFMSKLGLAPRFFRPPYGSIDVSTANILLNWGYYSILWNLDTYDWYWDSKKKSVFDRLNIIKKYTDVFVDAMNETDSFITLQHDRCTSIQAKIERYNYIIDLVRSKNFKFVTMSECIKKKPYFTTHNMPDFTNCNLGNAMP